MRATLGLLALLIGLSAAGTAMAVPPGDRKAAEPPAAVPASPPPAASAPAPPPTIITIVLAGDTGFAPHLAPVSADGVRKNGRRLSFEEAGESIAARIDGDINFANIETVVTDRNDLPRTPKTFSFRMHPAGMRHLVGMGLNLFSMANNHALDYGLQGADETLRHMAEIAKDGKVLGYAGLGATFDKAAAPALFRMKDVLFAFSAMGIAGSGVPHAGLGEGRAGQLNIHKDYAAVVARLAAADARFRILSMHFGTERQAQPDIEQRNRWRGEISRRAGIDILVGHHSHIPQGIEIIDGRLIFYGLGNFLHQGMSDMGGNNDCRDWGVMAKVHLLVPAEGRIRVAAVEVVPVSDMHIKARPLLSNEGHRRIAAMNGLSRALRAEDAGGEALRLLPQEDGSGLYCAPGSDGLPEPLRTRCGSYRAVERLEDGRLIADVPVAACGGGGDERIASLGERPRSARRRSASRSSSRKSSRRKGKEVAIDSRQARSRRR